jgi:hypothetical protein
MVLNPKEISHNINDSSLIHQKKPGGTKWSIWSNFIGTFLQSRQSTLKIPLGSWIVKYTDIRKKFESYRTLDKLYWVQHDTIVEYKVTKRFGKEWIPQSCNNTEKIPDHAIPALSLYFGWMYTSYTTESVVPAEDKNRTEQNRNWQTYNSETVYSITLSRKIWRIIFPHTLGCLSVSN